MEKFAILHLIFQLIDHRELLPTLAIRRFDLLRPIEPVNAPYAGV